MFRDAPAVTPLRPLSLAGTLLSLALLTGCGEDIVVVVGENDRAATPARVVPAQPSPRRPRVDHGRDTPFSEPAAPVVVRDEPVDAAPAPIEAESLTTAPATPGAIGRGNPLAARDENGIRLTAGFACSPDTLAVKCNGPAHFEVRLPEGGREAVGWFLFRV